MENESAKYLKARKRAKELKGFYSHLMTYLVVNTFMVIINLTTSPDHYWFLWPMLGWGFGLFWHFSGVFILNRFGQDWEDRKVKELMEKE